MNNILNCFCFSCFARGFDINSITYSYPYMTSATAADAREHTMIAYDVYLGGAAEANAKNVFALLANNVNAPFTTMTSFILSWSISLDLICANGNQFASKDNSNLFLLNFDLFTNI